jgi:hypothetical protein
MNKYQSNKMNAYTGVIGVLNQNRHIFEPFKMMNQAVAEFYDACEEIKEVDGKAESDTTGETAAKQAAKEKLAFVASSLAACGAVLAVNRSDPEMEAMLKYSYSDMRYGLDNEASDIAGVIESVLLKHRDELTDYMVSDQDLADLHQRIEVYSDSLVNRGGAKSGVVAENKRLIHLFKSTDDLLEQKIDRFVFRLKERFPKFHDAYHNARLITDL